MIKYTFLTTIYNEYDRNLIESVKSIINQSYSDFEYILINDGSAKKYDDEFYKLIDDDRVRFIDRVNNLGRGYSLNEGLKHSGGDYILIHDADDISEPNRLEEIDSFIKQYHTKYKHYPICVGSGFIIDRAGEKSFYNKFMFFGGNGKSIRLKQWQILIDMPFSHSTCAYNIYALTSVGGFSSEVDAAIDYFTVIKLSNIKNRNIFRINKILSTRTIDGKNYFMSDNIRDKYNHSEKIINEWIKNNVSFYYIKLLPRKIHQILKRIKVI